MAPTEAEIIEEATQKTTPWRLVVTFPDWETYLDAKRHTNAVLLAPAWDKPFRAVQYPPNTYQIRLGGQRDALVGAVSFYLGGWESAEVALRARVPEEDGPPTLIGQPI